MDNSDESDIENECPICFEDIIYFVPCKNNHRICNACYTKLHKECPWEKVSCPLCRIKISPKSSWKNTIKIILEEIEVSSKNKQTFLNQFNTAYSIMECSNINFNIEVIRSLRDIIFNLIEVEILDINIIHNAILFNIPIFIIDACINKYNLQYEDMNSIIIDAIIGGVRTNIILYLLEKYDFISYNYLFVADFDKINNNVILSAMSMAFFSLSIGMGSLMVYGSYLPEDTSIFQVSSAVAFFDTFVAILAGIIIFPIVFTYDLDPNSAGPGQVP